MKNKNFYLFLIFPIILILGLIILSTYKSDRSNPEEIKIVTTIFPVTDIASNIAGDKVEIVQLIPNGVSPHTFEPTVTSRKQITNVDIVFAIGQEFDDWALDLSSDENPEIVDLSDGIVLMGDDPHYWLAPENAKFISTRIAASMSEVDPENADYYEENNRLYLEKLDSLQSESKAKLDNLSHRKIVTFHDSFGYFAKEFDIEVSATIEPAGGKEPTAEYLSDVVKIVKENDIKIIFNEPQLSDAALKPLSKDYGIKIATLDPIGGVEGRDSYIELIRYNVYVLSENLK